MCGIGALMRWKSPQTRNVFKKDKRRRIKKKHKAKYLYINRTQMTENFKNDYC